MRKNGNNKKNKKTMNLLHFENGELMKPLRAT